MATVPSPATFTVGQKLTAALMNTNVRDAVNFLIAPPFCLVTASGTQAVANLTVVALLFDTESTDADGMHSTASNTDRLTAVTPGWYDMDGVGTFAANVTGSRFASFTINGATEVARVEIGANASAGRGTSLTDGTPIFLNAGDYCQFTVWQNSGVSLNISAGARFSAQWFHS